MSDSEIEEEIDKMEKESKAIREEIFRICWYMRGSLSLSEAMQLSSTDKELISKVIKDNLETTQKSKLPFF